MDQTLKQKIVRILDGQADMTVATNREDGFPQATTVSYVSDGLALYFGCGAESQKARNLKRDPRVSVTVNEPYETWDQISGVSLGGIATQLTDPAEIGRVGAMMFAKFPQAEALAGENLGLTALFRIDPVAISVLDYSKGFGHHDLVAPDAAGAPAAMAS